MLRINSSVLARLGVSAVWKNSNPLLAGRFTPEEIDGPSGKLNSFWNIEWINEDEMRSALYQNMGGGVPVEIIEELIALCADEVI